MAEFEEKFRTLFPTLEPIALTVEEEGQVKKRLHDNKAEIWSRIAERLSQDCHLNQLQTALSEYLTDKEVMWCMAQICGKSSDRPNWKALFK